MPSCNGPPNGPCPFKAKGDQVHFNYAELDLCDHCEQKHREAFTEANNACNTSVKSANLEERRKSCQDKVPEGPGISKSFGSSSVLLDPLLSYMVFSLQSGTVENVRQAVLGHFSNEDIARTKDSLWTHCGSGIIGEKPRRKDSSTRSVAEAHVSDILTAWGKLDRADAIPLVAIDALALGVIPRSHPEELNNISLVDRLNRLEARMSSMQSNMDNVIAQNFNINDQLKDLSSYASCVKRKPASIVKGNQTLEGGLKSCQGDGTPSTHPLTAKPISGEHCIKELSAHTDFLGQARDIPNLAELKEQHNNTQQDDNDGFQYPSHVIRKKRKEVA